jgi:hypothetical protein
MRGKEQREGKKTGEKGNTVKRKMIQERSGPILGGLLALRSVAESGNKNSSLYSGLRAQIWVS